MAARGEAAAPQPSVIHIKCPIAAAIVNEIAASMNAVLRDDSELLVHKGACKGDIRRLSSGEMKDRPKPDVSN